MEKRIEKWESLRLDVQKFNPQEYCVDCSDVEEYYIETAQYTCSSGADISCTRDTNSLTGHIIAGLHFGHQTITMSADAVNLVKTMLDNAPNFYASCGGVITGPYKVLCAPDNHTSNITPSTIGSGHKWHVAQCEMSHGSDVNPNAVFTVAENYHIYRNHS